MPKLSKEMAAKADEASGGFEPLPEDTYLVRLREVDPTKAGPKGPYWRWEFEVVDGEYKNRRLWTNTSLAENAAWKLKETFSAFGAGTDADTDDLCGQVCLAVVVRRVIESGNRQGEIGNNIDTLRPATDEARERAKASGASAGGSKDPDDIF